MEFTEIFVFPVDCPFALFQGYFNDILDVVAVLLVLFDEGFLDVHRKGVLGDDDVGGEE